MSKLLSTREPVRFQPLGDDGPAYLLRVPTPYDENELDIAILGKGARPVGVGELLAVMREAIADLLPDDEDAAQRTAFTELIEAHQERLRDDPVQGFLDISTDQTLKRLEDIVLSGSARYQELKQMQRRYEFALGWEAARRFVIGDGFDRGPDGLLTDESASAINATERYLIGLKIQGLMRPSETDAKNSDSPSPGDSSPESSKSSTPDQTATAKARPINRSKPMRGSSPKSASMN